MHTSFILLIFDVSRNKNEKDMKTYTTKRGIEFDLEIIEMENKSVEVMATCEEGSEYFNLYFDYPIKEDENLYARLLNGDTYDLEDMLDEVNEWVDQRTISYIASETAKVCLENSNESQYVSFSAYTNNSFVLRLFGQGLDENGKLTIETTINESASGETAIKDLLNRFK